MHDVKKTNKGVLLRKTSLPFIKKFIDGLEGIGTASFILKWKISELQWLYARQCHAWMYISLSVAIL